MEEHKCHICGEPATHHLESLNLWFCEKHFWIVAYYLATKKETFLKIRKILKNMLSKEEFDELPKRWDDGNHIAWGKYVDIVKNIMKKFGINDVRERLVYGDEIPICNICGGRHPYRSFVFEDKDGHIFLTAGNRRELSFILEKKRYDKFVKYLKKQAEYIKGGEYGKVGKGLVISDESKGLD